MAASSHRVFVAGVAMTPFHRPAKPRPSYVEVGRQAILEALADAQIFAQDVDAVVASYNYGEAACGHRVVHAAGLENVPIFNINGNCSAASVALSLARKLILSGQHRCVLVVGFEQMERGLSLRWEDRESPYESHFEVMARAGADPAPVRPGMGLFTSNVIKMFALAARQYMSEHPETPEDIFTVIAHKNRVQGALNSRALLSTLPVPESPQELAGDVLMAPITITMSASTATGAAAAVLVSEDWLRASTNPRTRERAIEIAAQEVMTDSQAELQGASYLDLVGVNLARDASQRCFKATGLTPSDVDVVELHDCFSPNELFVLEQMGFARVGEGAQLFREGRWLTRDGGGRQLALGDRGFVVNPSGGLETKGHPIGATGLAQCFELVTQLRGEATARQVPGATVGLQHNFGIGSTCVVTVYRRPGSRPSRSKL